MSQTKLIGKNFFWFLIAPSVLFGFLAVIQNNDSLAWLQPFIGTLCYLIVPGALFSLILFPYKTINFIERLSLTVAFSILLPPIIVYFLHRLWPETILLNFSDIFMISFFLALLWGAIAMVRSLLFIRKMGAGPILSEIEWFSKKEIIWLAAAVTVFTVLVTIFISRQPYIITADASYFFTVVRDAVATGIYPAERPQVFPFYPERYEPLMQSSVIVWHQLSSIELVSIFRFGVTFVMAAFILPVFLLAKELTQSRSAALLTLGVAVTTPVLMTAISVGRPQSFLFFVSPLILYGLVKFLKADDLRQYLWLSVSVLLFILSWRIHNLFVLMAPVIIATLVLKYSNWVKQKPWQSISVLTVVALAFYPYLRDLGILGRIGYFWTQIANSYIGINPLRNLFGPVTYGANYAFLLIPLILVLIYLLIRKQVDSYDRPTLLIVSFFAFIYFFFLEILPRLGYSFLPERSFPHLAIGLIILSSLTIKWLINQGSKRFPFAIFGLLLIGSAVATFYVNLLPTFQTISDKEVEAVQFLNKKPENILVITQKSNVPMIRQFGTFKVFIPTSEDVSNFFTADSAEESYQIVAKYSDYQQVLSNRIKSTQDQLIDIVSDPKILDQKKFSESTSEVSRKLSQLRSIYAAREDIVEWTGSQNDNYSIYVMYSTVKDRSYFNRRDYWKVDNFIGEDLSKFDNDSYFEKVFDNGDILVWKVRK